MSGDFDNPRPPGGVPPSAGEPPSTGSRPSVRIDRTPGLDRIYVAPAFEPDRLAMWVHVEGQRWTRVELTRSESDVVALQLLRQPQAAKRVTTLGSRASDLIATVLEAVGKHDVALWMVRDSSTGIDVAVHLPAAVVARVRRLLGIAPQADESIT